MSPAPPFARISARSLNHASGEATASGDRPTHSAIYLYHANLRQTGWRKLARLLSPEERRRADAFAFERDARRFIVSHAVLRTLLGHAAGIPPGELSFRREPGLKPFLEASTAQPIHFSLSRSEELALIGLASRPLGVDIECLGKTVDTEALSDFVLSEREQEAFRRLDPGDRQRAFLQYWIQKEAYLKAIGQGLNVSPATVEVPRRGGMLISLCHARVMSAPWRSPAVGGQCRCLRSTRPLWSTARSPGREALLRRSVFTLPYLPQ